jgi:hypothetical protein
MYVKKRPLPKCAKISPRLTPEAHGEEYYYSMLLLHKPWREEASLVPEGRSAEDVFDREAKELSKSTGNQLFADEVMAAAERLRVLHEEFGGPDNGGDFAGVGLDPNTAHRCGLDPYCDVAAPDWDPNHPPHSQGATHAIEPELEVGTMWALDELRDSGQGARQSNAQFDRSREAMSQDQRRVYETVRVSSTLDCLWDVHV